jgi:RNA ligase
MAEYHKIETLFERNGAIFATDPAVLKTAAFGTIREWDVIEKIDGTNVRVMLSEDGDVTFGGRSDNAQIHAQLLQHLITTFPAAALKKALRLRPEGSAVLYGLYRDDEAFILFDVLIEGEWWLDREVVEDIGRKLDIPTVPYLGRMTLDQIVALAREPFPSKIGTGTVKGVVARPVEIPFEARGCRFYLGR